MISAMSLPREQICKGCSLVVQPGYPKCPRCKMPLPKVEGPLATATKASHVKGGTVLADDESPLMLWVLGALLLIGIGVAIVVLLGDDKSAVPAQAVAREDMVAAEGRVNSQISTDPEIGMATQPGEPSDAEERRRALSNLDQTLSDARLWATVSVDSEDANAVSVVSSACEQAEMRPSLQSSAAPLLALGFASIRCVAKHGALVFELKL